MNLAVDQGQRPEMAYGAQMRELLAIAFEKIILAFFAADDEFEIRPRPQMAPDLEQHDVVQLVSALAARLPQISQFMRILFIGQKAAAARRLRIVDIPVTRRQRHLRLAPASIEVEQLIAPHPAFALG